MYLKVAGMAAILSGLQVLLLLRLTETPPWQIATALLAVNLVALTALFGWLKMLPKPKEDAPAPPADPTFLIANETLTVLRQGLNEETALKTAQIIQKISDLPAVAITDKEKVLAYIGVGCEKHHPGDSILTEATRQVIATGLHKVVQTSQELHCTVKNCDCPLAAAVIAPLKYRDRVIGSLKLYQTNDGQLPPHVIRLAIGIAQLLSMQMELAEVDRQTQLVTLARLDALHAQINPHFFFNTLNTIIMYSRTNPQRARRLLIHLAEFFRQTLKRHGHFDTLQQEMECVHTYLVLEKARFGKKLNIIQDVDQSLLNYPIPVLSIQPLVENAVKHGISPKLTKGAVIVSAHQDGQHIVITVSDNGVGIPPDKLPLVLKPGYGSGNGVGLSNVHERLKSLYHQNSGLNVKSVEGSGTTISFQVPLEEDASRFQQKEAL